MTTPAQQTALEQAAARTVFFAEFAFLTATIYTCTANITIPWNGQDWLGLGAIASISAIEESDSLDSKPLTFGLNAAQSSWLALALGAVEEYRGRDAKLYRCPLDAAFRLIDTPELCWRGVMDSVSVGLDSEDGKIMLRCETSAYGLKRRPALRMNAANQKQRVPSDDGFIYLTSLISSPQLWLSRAFQAK